MPTTEVPGTRAAPAPSAGESRAKAWGFTGLLMLLYIVNWADKAVFGLVAQPLAEELHLNSSQIGLIGSSFFLTFTVGNLIAGLLNRWTALKWSLALLAVGWSFAMLPLVVSATFTVLLLSRMLLGFLEGPSGPIIHTALYSWHPREKRGLPSACITACASIAKIAVAPALAVVVAAYGWRTAFVVLAAAGLVWLVIWLPTWTPGPYGEDKAAGTNGAADEPAVPWSKVLLSPTFLGAALAVMSMYALVTVVLTWLPSYFEMGLGYSRVQAGTMFGFPSIASIVVMFGLSWTGDRLIGRGATSRVLRGVVPSVALLVCGATMALLPSIGTPAAAVAVVSIGYAFGASIFPLFNAGLAEIVPPRQLASTLGIFMALMSLGGVYGPYLTGWIVDQAANPAVGYGRAFQIFGAMVLVGGFAALLGVNPERDAARLRGTARTPDPKGLR
ncbi:MFS transporter [Streptomyces ochraceiscleroticus]|uniref:MFS transporter n=1 Tax=Streptomyces ochraceiscleroticus TaxID=47761 RepID=A0ABW1MJ92_9ACTN|nr:MFS transporter [Streptomyces ochraceiscleroticus]